MKKIDRSRFFLLATTLSSSAAGGLLAASGCTLNTTNNNVVSDAAAPQPDSAIEPGDQDGSTTSGDAGSCLGDTLPAPACEGGDAGTAKCLDDCTRFNESFKSEIAASIHACLDQSAACGDTPNLTCAQQALAKACPDPSADTFCTTVLNCGTISGFDAGSGNPSDPQADCVSWVKGMKQEAREELKSCFDQYGLDAGACGKDVLSDCIASITQD